MVNDVGTDINSNFTFKDGDLIQFDLAFRNEVYCADISRVFPANGKFNEIQKFIYFAINDFSIKFSK